MHDRPIIVAGLIVFIGLFTFPIWHARAKSTLPIAPDIKLPLQEKQCVAPAGYMRDSHMQLLADWREEVVRTNQRQFTDEVFKAASPILPGRTGPKAIAGK